MVLLTHTDCNVSSEWPHGALRITHCLIFRQEVLFEMAQSCNFYRHELQAIKALAAALAPKARAIRDGKLEQVDAAQLVPGDIVLISIGNIIPADLKLLGEEGDDVPMQVSAGERCGGDAHHPRDVMFWLLVLMVLSSAQIDQAALTGESLPAKKFAGDVCFSGSTVKQGEKHAVVYATGMNTFFGRAASLIAVRPAFSIFGGSTVKCSSEHVRSLSCFMWPAHHSLLHRAHTMSPICRRL